MFPLARCLGSRYGTLCLTILLAVPVAAPAAEPSANWAEWRGPSGQGYSDDSRVPLTWSNTENLLWKTELPGLGNSTPIIWGNRIFLTSASAKGDERYLLCLTTDGKLLWKQTASRGDLAGQTHGWNGYASSSCATDGTHVYAFFGTPGLFCYDFDGKLVWRHQFGTFTSVWGTAASPFLYEDLVIQNCDHDGANGKGLAPQALIALDKKTGEERWKTERNQGRGFSTPVLIPTPEGRVDLVLNGPFGVWGYDPKTGKEVWHCERHKGQDQARFGEAVPVFDRNQLIMLSGRPGPMMAVKLGGSGNVTKTHVLWDVTRSARDVGSSILWKDLVYIAGRDGYLSCYDAATGKVVYKERLGSMCFSASPVTVQNKLLYLCEDGSTMMVEPGREFKAQRNVLKDDTLFRASPAIAGGRLYLRSQSTLYCIGSR